MRRRELDPLPVGFPRFEEEEDEVSVGGRDNEAGFDSLFFDARFPDRLGAFDADAAAAVLGSAAEEEDGAVTEEEAAAEATVAVSRGVFSRTLVNIWIDLKSAECSFSNMAMTRAVAFPKAETVDAIDSYGWTCDCASSPKRRTEERGIVPSLM
jgi:hypothetical protein